MINNTTALRALRAYLAANLSVCTTTASDVSATTSGYASAGGLFLTAGFVPGMEVVPTGFVTTTPALVTAVTASALTTAVAPSAEAAGAGKTLAVAVPPLVAWENIAFNAAANRWFMEEDYLPGPVQQVTLGPLGQVESLPQYILKFYGVAGYGPEALYAVADAVLTVFAPRRGFTVASGDSLAVRTSPAPYRSQLLQAEAGRPMIAVTVPLRLRSPNSF